MDPLEELNKASRSVRVSIYNTTNKKLVLKSHPITSGSWRVQPPETILPLSTVEFGSESSMMGSTEAGSIYTIDGSEGTFEFFWNNPYFGRKGFRKIPPSGYELEYTDSGTHNYVLKFTVKELDNGMKEIEDIEKDIKDLQSYINDADSGIKGMTKMSQVYQMQKDDKQVKLVENNIKEKTKHLEEMRQRKQQLEANVTRLRSLDTDPKAMEQQLTKIRESIESLVKQRKGMEHMREVYERSKDLKAMEALDKQVETKKNEIDSLRKKEQKVIQKVIELKKSLGLGATGIQTKKKVVALFDYTKSTDDELSIVAGDVIDIIHDEDPDWYGGQLNGQMGYFPKAFVGPYEQTSTSASSATDSNHNANQSSSTNNADEYTGEDFSHLYPKARVVYDHIPQDEGEIELKTGEIITVYSWENDYWWEGVNNGKTGYFPNTCVDWVEPEASATDYSDYSYYESTDSSTDDQQQQQQPQTTSTPTTTPTKTSTTVSPTPVTPTPAPVTPTPAPVIPTPTPTQTIQPPPTAFTAPNLKANTNTTTHTPLKRDLPTAPSPSPKSTIAPVIKPIAPTPATPIAPTPTPAVKPAEPTPTSTPTSTPTPTPTPTTTFTPAVPSKPVTSSASIVSSSASTQFDKILQPLIADFTKKLVEAHQKETALLNQKISALEKELRELKESNGGSTNIRSSVTSTATVVSKASPAVRKY
ncbi:hypothetical protein ACTFIU_002096 [Dictyostelium citrinum]